MDRQVSVMLRWSTGVLVVSGYWALTAVPQIDSILLLLPIVIVLCSSGAEYLHAQYPVYGTITRALTLAYLCFLPLTVISLGVLPAVTMLVAFIQIYTLLHQKTIKSYYHLQLMALFLLLAACVQSPEPVIGVIMLAFLVSGVWASIALRIKAETEASEALAEPEIIALDKLDHQSVHGKLGLGNGNVPLAATVVTILALGLTVLSFVLTPRIEAGLLGRSQRVEEQTGLSESVDLTSGSTINEDTTAVMMVSFPDEPGGKVPNVDWMYWRASTLGRYEGNSWHRQAGELFPPGIAHVGPNLTDPEFTGTQSFRELQRTRRPDMRLVHQIIYLDTIPGKYIPVMDVVQKVRLTEQSKGSRIRWESDGDFSVALRNSPNLNRLNYEVWSEPERPTPDELRSAPTFQPARRDRSSGAFLEHDLSEETLALTARITADADNDYDKALAIQSHLSGSDYLYTLNIPDMGPGSIIDTFINKTRLGHCELFGTAMALMLRSQGVPTRVVRGYRGGESGESEDVYTVRANMAHLWVEAWFTGFGWVIFDPSPQASEMGGVQGFTLSLSRALLRVKMFWFQEVVGFSGVRQVGRFKEFSFGVFRELTGQKESESEDAQPGKANDDSTGTLFLFLFLLMPTGGVITWLVFRRRQVPARTFALTQDQIQVVRLYMSLRRMLRHHGVDCQGQTAEELGEFLEADSWEAPDAATDVLACYNEVRFGGRPLPSDQLVILKRRLKAFRPAKVTQ